MWVLFLALAAICDAIMDTLKDHYEISVFHNWNKYFWNPAYSWNYHKKFFGIVELDAWHIVKYAYLFFLFLSIYYYKTITGWIDIPLMFIWWSVWFELFYSKLLRL